MQSSNRFSMTNEAHLTALGSIGLSQYESKCFLASLELGPSTINQIGITAGVPRTKVYGSVKKLVERGLIEQSEEDQKIFIARSPRDFLIPLLEKESRRIKESLDAMTELEVIHESMEYVKKAETLRSKVWRYSPRKAVTRKLRELFEESKKKVVVLTTANGLIRLSRMADVLYERSRNGLKVEIFTGTRDEPIFSTAVQSLNEIENCKISFLPTSVPIQIITIDSQYLLITELKPDDLKEEGMDVAFMIQNSELGEMMESLIRIIGPQILGEKINKILT
ncbi:MAG: helix-turn-helix domain-containing protein [archaeon]|nr:helix-turn-helix domain-containing protein [archaeon]